MVNQAGQVARILYKELVEGDLRKLQAKSNDADTGGGARDFRFSAYNTLLPVIRQMFPQPIERSRKRGSQMVQIEVFKGVFSWNGAGGVQCKDAYFEPPTDARPLEGRIARTVSDVSVFPDCVIEVEGTTPRMLLDAKYKGHVEKGQLRLAEADIYEALAFSWAAGCNLVVLAYPALLGDAPRSVGTCVVFEKVQVEGVQIIGIQIESRLISRSGALRTFSANLATGISGALL